MSSNMKSVIPVGIPLGVHSALLCKVSLQFNSVREIKPWDKIIVVCLTEWLRTLDSNSGVSDQQSVGSSPGHGSCCFERDTLPIVDLSVGLGLGLVVLVR